MRFIYYLLLITTPFSVLAQDSFLEHKTDKGETAYSVAQNHNISLLELFKFNPDIKERGIRKGEVLKIPIYTNITEIPKKIGETNTKTKISTPVLKSYTHTVGAGETLTLLSKMFNVSIEYITTENKEALNNGLKIGLNLIFPNPPIDKNPTNSSEVSKKRNYDYDDKEALIHTVLPQETLYSLARTYNVSVEDIIDKNETTLTEGLKTGHQIKIPTKKKTVDGRIRVINESTIFHTVLPFETKYSISRLYGITIEQLEMQNPEITTLLKEGNKLAINKNSINPKNATEELMLVMAEKQVAVEKTKIKNTEIQNLKEQLKEQLKNQEIINQKVVNINNLNFDLNLIDIKSTDIRSSEKLKLVLEANRKVQEVLRTKLDSLIMYMNKDLETLKKTPNANIEEIQKLEKASIENVTKTNEMSNNLKKELAENRRSYTEMMQKIEKIVTNENQEYRRKLRETTENKAKIKAPAISMEEVINYQNSHGENDIINELLINKVQVLTDKKKEEVKKQISEASFYSKKSRAEDDKLALSKLEKYKIESIEKRKKSNTKEEVITPIPLSKIIEFLTKNQTFYKNEITTMKVVKNLKDVNDGFYIVANEFIDALPRDEFIKKLFDDGEFNSGFFFNVNTLSYVVYLDKHTSFDNTIATLKQKEKNPYYKRIKILRLEYQDRLN